MRLSRCSATQLLMAAVLVAASLGWGTSPAQAVTPHCTSDKVFLLTHAADGDPILVAIPSRSGAGTHDTMCLLSVRDSGFHYGTLDVQAALRHCYGYTSVAIDGYFGPRTDAALRDFQSRHGLSRDGIYGPSTARKLLSESFWGETSAHHTPGSPAGCRSVASLIS